MRPTATTTNGPVIGTYEDGVAVFRGIPYAGPPVGARRWRRPQPPALWHEPLDASSFGPSALQPTDGPLEGLVPDMVAPPAGDGCLTLNVWTPAVDRAARPVMVWIHGGAFTIGSSALQTYDATSLAAREDVVVVSINYRLGALGFLLVDHPDAVANSGLLDQVAALTWVRDNVTAFGGSPGQVTVFGESAGAGSVLSLLSMPAAEGLFHGAIVQSGATDLVLDRERALQISTTFANEAGVTPGDLDALRALSDQQILDAQLRTAAALHATIGLMPFHPVADGKVMPLDWLESARAGTSRDVALVIGTTRDEMALFDSFDPSLTTLDDDGLRRRVAARGHPAPDRLVDAYRGARPDATPGQLWSAITTDIAMWLPALRIAEAHAAHQPDTWMYRFDWPAADPALGACHGIDIPFPFDTVERAGWEQFLTDASAAHALARAQQAAWAAFARTGEPATGALPRWPRFSPASRATMVLAREPHVEHDPAGSVRAAWSTPSNLPA